MKTKITLFSFLLPLLIVITTQKSVGAGVEKIKVMVTIPPFSEFVQKIGAEKVEVNTMVPSGANPHVYEPTPNQLKLLSNTKLYVAVGSGIEFELAWLGKLQAINPQMKVCFSSEEVSLIDSKYGNHVHREKRGEHRHAMSDPHVWLSPKNVIRIVQNIERALIQLDPSNQMFYRGHTQNYIAELKQLDQEIRKNFVDLKRKQFMVYHPAWAYFANDYGLAEIPIEIEGKEPTTN